MRLLNLLETIVRGLAALCLGAVFLLVTAQVASRFLLDFSLAAASELSIYSMVWSVFLGAAVAFRGSHHIAVDVIVKLLPTNLQRLVDILIFILLFIFLSLIVVKGYDLSLRAMRQISPSAGLPIGYVSMAMPICSVLALIFLVEEFVLRLKKAPQE